jgi:secreted Zn-dependent insulinase-like peptidase
VIRNLQQSLILLCLLALCTLAHSAAELNQDIIKSPNDARNYAALTLPNQLQVLLISDPDTDKAAAALDVAVGSADDPAEFQGLAHFLEHMLFLGTERYPEANAYQKFISEHGGSHNAFTAPDNTNYFFDIQAAHLAGALDRFAQQFVAPLFNAEYVEREVNAVHSEFTAGIRDDGRRLYDVLKQTLHPAHPYAKFSVGNLDSLGNGADGRLREALLKFYHAHYAARRMRLVVLGRENLATLRDWVTERFSAIPNPSSVQERADVPPYFAEGYLPAKIEIQSVMDKRTMIVAFPVPSEHPHYRSQPIGYLTNLLGHEGEGSLLSALKNEQLVDSLAAGGQFDNRQQALLVLTLGLTEKGLTRQERVIERIFDYIELMRREGIRQRYFDETATMLGISFRYLEKSEPIQLVSSLAGELQDHPAHDVLHAGFDLSEYRPELYREFLDHLRPDNMLQVLMHKGVQGEQTTRWYATPWRTTPLPYMANTEVNTATSDRTMHLPADNPFIPEHTELIREISMARPELLSQQTGLTVWHASDTEFGTPRASLFVTLRSPLALQSADHLNRTELMVSLLKDALNEFSYPALLAGLDAELYNHMRGVTLKISGYSDKQSVLLQQVLLTMLSASFPEDRFQIARERLQRNLLNAQERRPYEQTMARLQRLLIDPSWTEQERLAALENTTLDSVRQFRQDFFSELDVAVLQTGNVTRAASLNIANTIDSILLRRARPTRVARADIVRLDAQGLDQAGHWALPFDVEHPDTGFIHYLQGRDKSLAEQTRFLLLAQYLASNYYTQIRTEQQLGYIVFASGFELLEVPGLAFIVQSPTTRSATLLEKTRSFLQSSADALATLDEAEFERHRKSLISRLEKQDSSLYERSNRYWQEIDRENADFNTREVMIEILHTLSRPQLADFFRDLLARRGSDIVVYSDRQRNGVIPNTRDVDPAQVSMFGRFRSSTTATEQSVKGND